VASFGVSTGNWLSFAACLALPLPPLVRRIHLEEGELSLVLGDSYREYESGKARLIPRVW
jgi:protein-S-isoprenylcysteine O-methyltransferase Ste14